MLCIGFLHLLLPVYCTAHLLISILQPELSLQNNYLQARINIYISTIKTARQTGGLFMPYKGILPICA
ncbi:MAG: hypothetical protein IIX62_06215, partial [Peptococcaceae bacterium]|nr:hypothetical protein [Peptococcaceae bacterium]